MKLQKIPIDYNKADSGDAPFDCREVIAHDSTGNICIAEWDRYWNTWYVNGDWLESDESLYITHYTPIPEFKEVKGEKEQPQ